VLRPDVCVHQAHPQLGERLVADEATIAQAYVRSWATGLYRRKPFAGFHPAIYADQHPERAGSDPLAHWLRAGRPPGPWSCRVITPADAIAPQAIRTALHIHAYYADLVDEIVKRLAVNALRPDLFVSVTSEDQRAVVTHSLRAYEGRVMRIELVPNRGRDLGPFLSMMSGATLDGYDLVGHLHTKKSVDVDDRSLGQAWYRFLLENLVGGQQGGPMLDRIATAMTAADGPDVVFPEDPYVFGDEANAPMAADLARRAGWNPPPPHYRFPVGSMFWARPAALLPLMELDLQANDYPQEPLPYDGTILHALERALGLAALARPSGLAVTNIPGVTR
jgi:lipopolysaccharide biosynthesis protein